MNIGKIVDKYNRLIPSQMVRGYGHIQILVVLVEGNIGDNAAYIGVGSEDWVRKYGNKLLYEEARRYFPGLSKEHYRE